LIPKSVASVKEDNEPEKDKDKPKDDKESENVDQKYETK